MNQRENWEKDALEFYKIKERWSELALTQSAKERIGKAEPMLSENELLAKLRETTEAKMMIETCGNPPLVSLNGVENLLETARKGECLGARQLEEIETALVAVKRLKDYLEKGKRYEISLPYYAENLNALEEVREEIRTQVYGGEVAENASKLLKSLRSDIARAEDKMREKADGVIRANKECMSDLFSTFRNGHVCIPVKKEYKWKISGTVIDKSSTGSTLFIEPAASAKFYEELQELRLDEENEVRRILYELTALVDDHAETIKQDIGMIEKLDFIFAKGKLSLSYDGTEPQILQERCIVLEDARHPLMEKEICVPLQFSIGNGISGIVITGPNTGGKTVAIKTVALNCMMAQCGLHVACKKAKICMNSNFLCDIGDGQNLSENLSTFSVHITNVLDILRKVNKDSLVIMDELGSGTDPMEGMGIAVAILEELKNSGALFLVTTHYPEVKTYAQKTEGIVNARMTFDRENLKPLYQMVIGEAGESCALYIAKRLGMPLSMLKRAAKEAYGEDSGEHLSSILGADSVLPEPGDGKETAADRNADELQKETAPHIIRKKPKNEKTGITFRLGDSVMVYPDQKIGIVCQTANEKGVLRVQLPDKKIWINHKRVKLQVAAEELYPENYDFSIIFDTVENRKLRHQMEKGHVEGKEIRMSE